MPDLDRINAANRASLAELRALCAELSEADLLAPMPAGWTPASVLLHCAFWDTRAVTLIARWRSEPAGESPIDTDVVNEVARPLFQAVAPHQAVLTSLTAAEAVNRAVANLTPSQLEDVTTLGTSVHLDRSEHRYKHMRDIRTALGR